MGRCRNNPNYTVKEGSRLRRQRRELLRKSRTPEEDTILSNITRKLGLGKPEPPSMSVTAELKEILTGLRALERRLEKILKQEPNPIPAVELKRTDFDADLEPLLRKVRPQDPLTLPVRSEQDYQTDNEMEKTK